MADPCTDSGTGTLGAPEVRETHLSWVFLAGDRAYKLLKPVTLPFIDLARPDARARAVQRELDLNRRIAPDVYLGLADVREGEDVVDRMLVMRRMPSGRALSNLVDDPDFDDHLRSVARAVAHFHESLDPVLAAPMATPEAVLRNWEDNLATLRGPAGSILRDDEVDRAGQLARRYLAGRGPLLERRIADGMVRDGHGDLLADDIFCLADGPRILDCLAFSDEYRIGDVLLDVAFLVMDVERLAGWSRARDLLHWYCELTAEHHPATLAHHYVAYRAHVRAKVACLRHAQGHEASATLARWYHRAALDHLERARVRLVLVGGGPGTGKSVLAEGLAGHYGGSVLSTDEIRKDLSGIPHHEHAFAAAGQGIYDRATTDAAYAELVRQAGVLAAAGETVVLDGTWTREEHRRAARQMAADHHADVAEVECTLDPETARERIGRRLANPWTTSDATPDLVDHLARARERWPEAAALDTSAVPGEVLARAVDAVERAGQPRRSDLRPC